MPKALTIERKSRKRDLHFYITEEHVRKFDDMCHEHHASRGLMMQALIDDYLKGGKR